MSFDLKLSMFRKILLFFILGIIIPTLSISTITIYNYSVELEDNYTAMMNQNLRNVSQQLQTLFQEIDRFSFQLSLSPSLNTLLRSPDEGMMFDYYLLQNNLVDQLSVNSMLQSEYIYFRLNDQILTSNEGLYSRNSFYDQALINRLNSGEALSNFEARQIQSDRLTASANVITWERALPFTKNPALGYLVVNVKKDAFFSVFKKMIDAQGSDWFILDPAGKQTIFQSDATVPNSVIIKQLSNGTTASPLDGISLRWNGKKYLMSSRVIQPGSWVLVNLMPQQTYNKQLYSRLRSTVRTSSIVILLGFFLSYFFAWIIYSPWKDFVRRYPFFFDSDAFKRPTDEYSLIRQGIDRLLNENRQIKSITQKVEPLVRYRMIVNLLQQESDASALSDPLLEQNGLRFTSPYHIVCIVASESKMYGDPNDYQQMKLVLFGLTENILKSECEVDGTILDEGRFAFILGLPRDSIESLSQTLGDSEPYTLHKEWKQRLIELSQRVNQTAHEKFHTGLQFSFGRVSRLSGLHLSYTDAKRGLIYKALLNRTDVVFVADLPAKRGLDYPDSLQFMLLKAIKTCDKELAEEAVHKLFQQYVLCDSYPPEEIHHLLFIFIGSTIQQLLQEGYTLDEVNTGLVALVYEAGNNRELEMRLIDQIHEMLDKLDAREGHRIENLYIAEAIRFMEEHYKENISISTIADHVGLSPSYLSRIFKTETGKTPLDYLSRYRIERSKLLLTENEVYSIQEIGVMIGYPDVQSFIRYFKKYEAVTPNIYRKMLSE